MTTRRSKRRTTAEKANASAEAEAWNVKHPIGTRVRFYPIRGDDKSQDTVTRSEAWEVCGTAVVLLEGRSGGCALDHLELLPEPPAPPADPWDHADYYACSPDAESLSCESPEEAIEDYLDGLMVPGDDPEAVIAERAPIEVFAWTRKVIDPTDVKLWVQDLTNRLNERWQEDEYGDPDRDYCDRKYPPGDAAFMEALTPIVEAAVGRAHVWQCDGIGEREFSLEQVLTIMREHCPHWFKPGVTP